MTNTIVLKDLLMKETIKLLDDKLVITQFANRAFTGELKKQGDTVTVQTFPNLVMNDVATAGENIASQYFVIKDEDLVINKVGNANYEIKDIEEIQSNLDLQSNVADRLAYQLARKYDTFVGDLAIDGAANEVATAALTKANVFAEIEKMRVKLEEDNAGDDSALFVRPDVASLIRQAPERDGFREGAEARIKAYVGTWSDFKIYQSNNVPAGFMFVMDRNSVNFVEQFNGMKITEANEAFRYNMLLEVVYGGKVFDENAKRICKHPYTIA